MKRICLAVLLIFSLICTAPALALDDLQWFTTNQFTVAWDAVTTNINGEAIPANEIEYQVYLVNSVTDPNKTNPSPVWRGAVTEATLTLNTEGKFIPGVKVVRVVGGEDISESTISYSDNPEVTQDSVVWGVRYYIPMSNPLGFRPQPSN